MDQAARLRRAGDGAVLCERVREARGLGGRFRGLMLRAPLDQGEGLYLRTNSIHMLFMRFAIDALFLSPPDEDDKRRVVALRHGLPPWRGLVLPVRDAEGVVELPSGTLRREGVEPGQLVRLETAATA